MVRASVKKLASTIDPDMGPGFKGVLIVDEQRDISWTITRHLNDDGMKSLFLRQLVIDFCCVSFKHKNSIVGSIWLRLISGHVETQSSIIWRS
jgi:hypothetical protein